MIPFLQLPTPPPDYGYVTTILVSLGVLLLSVIGFIAREYLRYRNAQDEKRDKQYAEAEALRVEARQRLDALVNTRFDQSEDNTSNLIAGVEAKIAGIERTIEAHNGAIQRLNEITKPK